MARLPHVLGMKAVKAFSKDGWFVARQTGSHVIMVKTCYGYAFDAKTRENLIEVLSENSSDSPA